MKITVITPTEESLIERDYRDYLTIRLNDNLKLSFWDGEPEDSTLARDFNDCCRITEFMKLAYEAGRRGEEFVIEHEESDDD